MQEWIFDERVQHRFTVRIITIEGGHYRLFTQPYRETMKYILFLLVSAFMLGSCKKAETYCWQCETITESYNSNSNREAPVVQGRTTEGFCDKTQVEIERMERAAYSETTNIQGNVTLTRVTSMHCTK